MPHEIQLDLVLTQFKEEADEISSILGLKPTKSWRQGDQIQRTTLKRKENGWDLSSGISPSEGFEKHLASLIQQIRPSIHKFAQLPSNTEIELSCAVHIHEEGEQSLPWIHLDHKTITILNQLGADVDFDLYVVSRE